MQVYNMKIEKCNKKSTYAVTSFLQFAGEVREEDIEQDKSRWTRRIKL